jgi:hypothetical protein
MRAKLEMSRVSIFSKPTLRDETKVDAIPTKLYKSIFHSESLF